MTLIKRILIEKRAVAFPLLFALLANVAVYALVVYPLAKRASGAVDRAAKASEALKAAERDQAAAQALVTGKARAEEELATFYDRVLPADYVSARRMTYTRLPALARKANFRYESGSSEVDQTVKSTRVGRLQSRMILQGDYQSFRRFVYEVESSPEFLIIDSVSLAQSEAGKPLVATLEMSTYYRTRTNGS
jgi:Tfp pilus assembly protein PilO